MRHVRGVTIKPGPAVQMPLKSQAHVPPTDRSSRPPVRCRPLEIAFQPEADPLDQQIGVVERKRGEREGARPGWRRQLIPVDPSVDLITRSHNVG
jgi:hypothetical protein